MSFAFESSRPSPPGPSVVNWLTAAQTVVLVVLSFLVLRMWLAGPQPAALPPPSAVEPAGNLADDEKATIQLFRQSSQSVVYITTLAEARDQFNFNALEEAPRGTGTGFLWDAQGHVVTNAHVVEAGNRWKVTLADQSTWDATLVGVAPDRDLAVLRIDAGRAPLQPIRIGSSTQLEVGQKVFAIGNPFGLDQTLTTGVISGLGREIRAQTGRTIEGVIQTDAAINPGNSGGPLLSSAGEVIGVNSAIISPSGVSAGIGFAIPVDVVKRIVPQLIAHGKVIRAGLGIRVASDNINRQLELSGVLVINVVPGGPAADAGLLPTRRNRQGNILLGDVILAINDQPITTSDELFNRLESLGVGSQVRLKVLRGARTTGEHETELTATLVELD